MPTGVTGVYVQTKTVRDFNGRSITFNFDELERLSTKVLPQVSSTIPAKTVAFGYFTSGKLAKVTESTSSGPVRTNFYTYDSAGRLTRKDVPEGILAYEYNENNNVTALRAFRRGTLPQNSDPFMAGRQQPRMCS